MVAARSSLTYCTLRALFGDRVTNVDSVLHNDLLTLAYWRIVIQVRSEMYMVSTNICN